VGYSGPGACCKTESRACRKYLSSGRYVGIITGQIGREISFSEIREMTVGGWDFTMALARKKHF
jgi:hypothetical protein